MLLISGGIYHLDVFFYYYVLIWYLFTMTLWIRVRVVLQMCAWGNVSTVKPANTWSQPFQHSDCTVGGASLVLQKMCPPPKKKERERGSKMKRKRLNERKWEKGKVRCATKERWCYWSTWGWLIHKLVMPHGPTRTHKCTQIHTESCILRHAYAIHKYLVTWLNTHPNTHPYTHQYTSHPLVWNWFSETCVLVQQLVTNEPKWPPPCHSFQARAGNDGPWGRKTGREEGSEGLDLNGAH